MAVTTKTSNFLYNSIFLLPEQQGSKVHRRFSNRRRHRSRPTSHLRSFLLTRQCRIYLLSQWMEPTVCLFHSGVNTLVQSQMDEDSQRTHKRTQDEPTDTGQTRCTDPTNTQRTHRPALSLRRSSGCLHPTPSRWPIN